MMDGSWKDEEEDDDDKKEEKGWKERHGEEREEVWRDMNR